MQTLKGNSVCNGIACGKIFFINKSSVNIERKPANDIPKELNRLEYSIRIFLCFPMMISPMT